MQHQLGLDPPQPLEVLPVLAAAGIPPMNDSRIFWLLLRHFFFPGVLWETQSDGLRWNVSSHVRGVKLFSLMNLAVKKKGGTCSTALNFKKKLTETPRSKKKRTRRSLWLRTSSPLGFNEE